MRAGQKAMPRSRIRNTRFHKLVNGFTLIIRYDRRRRIRPDVVCHSASVPAAKLAIARVRSTETKSRESESS